MEMELKFKAYHYPSKLMYWFDLMWGNKATIGGGYIAMLPIGEEREYGNSENRIAIDPENCRILQYMGIKDKNGKEIYSGDILKVHVFTQELCGSTLGVKEGEKEFTGTISFKEFGLWLECNSEEESGYLLLIDGMIHEESFEITGNIYEINHTK